MKTRYIVLIGCILCALLGITGAGCDKENPAEKAGKIVDEALESAKKTAKELTDE